jgi:hypothetical protein
VLSLTSGGIIGTESIKLPTASRNEKQKGEEREMKSTVSYKNYLIRAESFQREKNGTWIPQYNFTRQTIASKGNDFPSQQYQLNEALPTEDAADDFALQKAMEWIDKAHLHVEGQSTPVRD